MPRPSFDLLDLNDVDAAAELLADAGLLSTGETIRSMVIAGPGNMNLVLRVETDRRQFIAKQSRPWVQKFPEIAAPEERMLAEIGFYHAAATLPDVIDAMPRMIGTSVEHRLMLLEDLGAAADYGHVYASQTIDDLPVSSACQWLSTLHVESHLDHADGNRGRVEDEFSPAIGCHPLRQLNHEHIFVIPFAAGPPIDLDAITPGLSKLQAELVAERDLIDRIALLGNRYLYPARFHEAGDDTLATCLLHGDYYPGSWLHTGDGFRVIDAEFCFVGPAEFDLSVFVAHCLLAGGNETFVRHVIARYRSLVDQRCGYVVVSDESLIFAWAGVEILRRLLGVAQLPLPDSIDLKKRLVESSVAMIRQG